MCSPTFRRLFVCFVFVLPFFFAPPTPPPRPNSTPTLRPPRYVSLLALAVSSALLFYSLAAAGQLINQIFKQCFSAQWEVLDYLWLLAVPGAATHYQPPPLRLPSSSLAHTLTHSLTHSLIHSLTHCLLASAPSFQSHFLTFSTPSLVSPPAPPPPGPPTPPPPAAPSRPQIVARRTLSLYNCSFSRRLPDSAARPLKELSSLPLFIFASFSPFSLAPRSSRGRGRPSSPRGLPSPTDYHSVSAQLSCGLRCL